MNTYEQALAAVGLSFPKLAAPVANYVPFTRSGSLVFISGQVTLQDGEVKYVGKLGADFSVEQGQAAARLCALNVLGWLREACDGDLDRVVRCLRMGGFVNCTPEFAEQPQVMNGASDLMVAVLGDRGRHARAAVGVNALPRGVAVEVDAIFEIR
ncbi:MAG: RidA family protein [Betaproteobacteria bacterium]|nr:RidA family protein [Betaproteobacteria bacterium]